MNGHIYLILGNHDMRPIQFYYDYGFHRVYDRPIIINEYFILTHRLIESIDEKEVENILICQEESIYDTFIDIINTTKFDLDESKIILIQKE